MGVFDTGGIVSVTPTEATNGSIQQPPGADPSSQYQYLRFTPGQTGPLAVIGVRTDPTQPASWAFDVTDTAGNTSHCRFRTPTAVNDTYVATEDAPLTVPGPGVLGNDTDPDGRPLVLGAGNSLPTNGTVAFNGDGGSFTYRPGANFSGTDSFTYFAITDRDGQLFSNEATVSLTVNSVNDAPVAGADSYATTEETPLTVAAPGVLGNDTDADGDALSAGSASTPANGRVALSPNGSFTYTPNVNFASTDTFTYVVSDGKGGNTPGTVTMAVAAVNDGPVAANDSYGTNEDTPLTVAPTGVLGNDTDVDGDSLTAVKVNNPTHGSVTLNTNGSFTYTPAPNYNGADSFTYTARDGTADSNVATVNLTVNPINDAPVATNDSYSTAEDTALTVAAPAMLANDSDVDGNALSAVKVNNPTHGSVTLNTNGSFNYTPAPSYNGADSFTYKANDGTADSNVATVNLSVTPVNDAPVANPDTYTTASATALSVPAPGVLGNDTDADGDALSAVSPTTPAHGTVALNANGSFTYTPTAGFSGTDTFTYAASNANGGSSTATVSITVTAPGDTRPTELAVNDLSVAEANLGTAPAIFTITRSGNVSGASTLKYKTSGGTATAGVDYSAVSSLQTLTFAAGETTKTVSVAVTGDTAPEANETFNLVLSSPTGAVLTDTTGVATIVNDDGSAYLTVGDIVVNEGDSGTTPATFTVTRSGNANGTSTVTVKTGGGTATAGTDYNAIASTVLTFNPGDTAITVPTTVIGDTVDEANETFNLVLSLPSGGTVLSDASGTATIVDNEGTVVPGPTTFLRIADVAVTEGNSGPTVATLTVTRSGNVSAPGTVKYVTGGGIATAGTDYTSTPAGTVLNFAAGQTSATVTVNVTGDTFAEANETFNVTLSGPTTGTVLSDPVGTATIVSDDGAAYLTVANISGAEGNSGATPFTFTITRSGNTTGTSTVKVATSGGTATGGGTDYTSIPAGTLVSFAAGQTSATVTVNVTGDTTVEPNETFNLVLSTPVGATVSDTSGTATIVNDD
jgi:VCBS repeat-containing protein